MRDIVILAEEFEQICWEIIKKKGMEKGMEKGIQQGIKQVKIEVATKMLEEGVDTNFIAEITDLSLEKIKTLKAQKDLKTDE